MGISNVCSPLNRRRVITDASESLPVASSAIARMAYDPDTRECTFTFYRGGSYTSTIPEIEVHRWINSESIGRYFNANIRGKY